MKKYVIVSDTGCDMEESLRKEFDIEYIPMHYSLDGKDYAADLDWGEISAPDFYNTMRGGKRFITSQVNVEDFKKAFSAYLVQGYDILYISCSSALSSSINASRVAREALLKEYPDAKIVCIDGLRACYALGLLAIRASELRAEGKTIEETAAWIEANKDTVHMIGTVDKLTWLKQAGRVSATSAFFGGLLNIKPIIVEDAKGQNFAMEKVKGRMTSLNRMVEIVKETWEDVPYQRLYVSHTDCVEEAEKLKEMLLVALGKEIDVHIGYIGPCVGASVGPGTLSINYFGKKVTLNGDA